MSKYLIAAGAVILFAAGCTSDDKGNGIVADGDALASYTVTFTAEWSATTHPVDFPANAHFSGLIGATHNHGVVFWRNNELATAGIQDMAERGRKSPLSEEVDTAITEGSARFKLSGDGIDVSPGSVSLDFTVSVDHPLVSLVSMIAPSPDWFVGVADLQLRDGDDWVDSLTVDLYAWDAGTDDGVTYTSANAPSTPHVPIYPLADGIFMVGDSVPTLGTFTFFKQQ